MHPREVDPQPPPPPKPRRVPVVSTSLTLPQDLFLTITQLAERDTMTRSAVIVRLCRAGLEAERS